jgi:hypothetical protein
VFRKQFLANGLTNSQKQHPRLSQLRHEIVNILAPIAAEFGISMTDIGAIHEDSARTHASHTLKMNNLPVDVIRIMEVKNTDLDDEDTEPHLTCAAGSNSRVTCAAVTSEYFMRSMTVESEVLEVFIENDLWSQINVYVRGATLVERMGSTARIRLHLVDKNGRVFGGKS